MRPSAIRNNENHEMTPRSITTFDSSARDRCFLLDGTGRRIAGPASAVGLRPSPSQTIARKVLRGYGPVEGTFTKYVATDGHRSSVLVITCADAERASLCLGKYSSDLHSLGGVADGKLTVGGVELPVVEAPGQGSIVACRQGRRVAIVAAAESRDLVALLSAMQVARLAELDFAGSEVPMYLDRYDKYGWHFYFDPWSKPPQRPGLRPGPQLPVSWRSSGWGCSFRCR